MDLQGKHLIVTGGVSGLGKGTVQLALSTGARVTMFDINEKLGASAEAEFGDKVLFAKVDVKSEAEVKAGMQAGIDKFGPIHGVVNCAGFGAGMKTVGKGVAHDLKVFQDVIELNLVGTFNVTRLVCEHMIAQEPLTEDGERGVVVNTASVAAYDGQIGQVAYSASKAGVCGMTLPIARDLARNGIRICTIAPGLFETPLVSLMPDKIRQPLEANTQFPKRFGVPKEFGQLVVHIFENTYLNGEIIRLDSAIRMPPR